MFITLEGPDGSGKTMQVPLLAEYLRHKGREVVTTREPGGTEISNQVRQVIMNLENKSMFPRTETLLFCAARAQLVDEIIRPALAAGKIVISDRYADSTLAYQGYGHGNDLEVLRQLLAFATGGLKPDLTLLLDIEPECGLRRRKSGGGEWNRMDDYALAFHRRVCEGYHELARQNPHRWAVVNADQEPEKVQQDIRVIIDHYETRGF